MLQKGLRECVYFLPKHVDKCRVFSLFLLQLGVVLIVMKRCMAMREETGPCGSHVTKTKNQCDPPA